MDVATGALSAGAAGQAGAERMGIGISLASLRRFWAAAARWNSSRAPFGPRNRSRSSRRMRLRCANSISTFLRSRREASHSSSSAMERARLRAPSCTDRVTLRASTPGQHRGFSVQACSRACWLDSGRSRRRAARPDLDRRSVDSASAPCRPGRCNGPRRGHRRSRPARRRRHDGQTCRRPECAGGCRAREPARRASPLSRSRCRR